MYAIISDGGRQYKVREGEELDIDYRKDSKPGSQIQFERVLAVSRESNVSREGNGSRESNGEGEQAGGIELGAPVLSGVSVTAEVIGVTRGEKVYIQKLRRRKNHRRRTGHRQWYTQVRIGAISGV